MNHPTSSKRTPSKEAIRLMLSLRDKIQTEICVEASARLEAARADFAKPTEYMLSQQRSTAALMTQLVGHPIRRA